MDPKDHQKLAALVRKYGQQAVKNELDCVEPNERKTKPKKTLETLRRFDRMLIAYYFVGEMDGVRFRNDRTAYFHLVSQGLLDGKKREFGSVKQSFNRAWRLIFSHKNSRGGLAWAQEPANRDK